MGDGAKSIQGNGGVLGRLVEPGAVVVGTVRGQRRERHTEREEMLLRPVVKIALELATGNIDTFDGETPRRLHLVELSRRLRNEQLVLEECHHRRAERPPDTIPDSTRCSTTARSRLSRRKVVIASPGAESAGGRYRPGGARDRPSPVATAPPRLSHRPIVRPPPSIVDPMAITMSPQHRCQLERGQHGDTDELRRHEHGRHIVGRRHSTTDRVTECARRPSPPSWRRATGWPAGGDLVRPTAPSRSRPTATTSINPQPTTATASGSWRIAHGLIGHTGRHCNSR